jgi:hypothetical protein
MIRKIVYSCQTEQTAEAVSFVLDIIRIAESLQILHWEAALDFLPNVDEVLTTLNQASFPCYTLTVDKWHPRSIVPTRPLRVLTLKQGPWSGSITLSAVLDLALSACKEPVDVEKLILIDIGEYYGDAVDMTGLLELIKPPRSICLIGCHLDWKAFATVMAWADSSLAFLVIKNCEFHQLDPAWDPFPDQPIPIYADRLSRLHYMKTDTLSFPLVPIPAVSELRITRVNAANFTELPRWLNCGTSLEALDFRQSTRDEMNCPSMEAVRLVDDLARRGSVKVLPEDFLKELASWTIAQTSLNEQKLLEALAAKEAQRQEIKGSGLLDDDFPLNLFDLPDEDEG